MFILYFLLFYLYKIYNKFDVWILRYLSKYKGHNLRIKTNKLYTCKHILIT